MIKKDIRVYRGELFKMTIKTATGVLPFDLSQATVTSHIKRKATDTKKIAEFDVSTQEGTITLTLKPQATELLVMQEPVEKYVYDVRCETSGEVYYLVRGEVTLVCNVTGGAR